LPIIVDYSKAPWDATIVKNWTSALSHPDRVCSIAIMGSPDKYTHQISEALDVPLPALESVLFQDMGRVDPINLAPSFITSIQSLQHLRIDGGGFRDFLPLLSVSTSLVDLSLSFRTIFCLTKEGSLLTHLQRMPHLRNLQVSAQFSFDEEMPPTTTALLAGLTSFSFQGQCDQIEWLVAGLVTPSLRELRISFFEMSSTLHIPYLSKFIRVAGIVFFAARLTIFRSVPATALIARPLSMDDPPSKIVLISTAFSAYLGSSTLTMFATLEDIFLSFSSPLDFEKSLLGNLPRSRKFFEEFYNVKVLRFHHGLETEIVDMLRQPTVDRSPAQELDPDARAPSSTLMINNNRSQFTLDILPSLEEIVVYTRTPDASISEKERASVLQSFGPFATARRQMGRPVKIFWDTNGEVPRYFTIVKQ
jgi:hypothetical protein